MNRPYYLSQGLKTKLLNKLRTLFIIPVFENLLLKVLKMQRNKIIERLVPPNYLFKSPTERQVNYEGVVLKLDVSNVVDHFIYFDFKDEAQENLFSLVNSHSVIIDIGSNIGATALQLAQRSPHGFVYGFEPDKSNYKRACENISLNKFSNIHLENFGLGNKDEKLKLFQVNHLNPGMNRILLNGNDKLPYEEIEIKTLDSYVKENNIKKIDIIKIDVEGFENQVLLGASETIKKNMPLLFVEVIDKNLKENDSSALKLFNQLKEFGYKSILNANTLAPVKLTALENANFDIIAREK